MTAPSRPRGLSSRWADLFGMPHIGAGYDSYESGAYHVDDGESCAICMRPGPLTAHHVVPRSVMETVVISGIEVRSPLWALCGHGTAGCHGGCHGGARWRIRWEWDDDESESAWWSGELLRELGPHSDGLFRHGCYVVEDLMSGREMNLRA